LRSDLSQITIGKYVILCENVIIKPPLKRQNNLLKFAPIDICNFVFIDKNAIVQALKIGNYSRVGKDCIIGQRVVIG
jgi:acetyltransferase-like isoleucine patch superfamily enzyme